MVSCIFRRRRIAFTIGLCGLLLLLGRAAVADSDAGGSGFRFQEIDDNSLGLWEGDRPVLVYNFGEMTLPGVERAKSRSSYVHPIYGPDGEVLTDDFPADHYHHHGLFWAWPHVEVGGRSYDLWLGRGIRIEFQRWLAKEANGEGARLGVENGWFVGDKQVMKEEAWFDVHPASGDGRHIDVTLTWTPLDEPVTLRGAEGKSYGGVTLRFAPRTGTVVTVPGGRASEDLLITRLPWADLSAKFEGAAGPSGIALFIHPQHPDYPPECMTREYGVLAVGWPGVNPQTLPAGEPVTCRYRLWVHRGSPDAAEIESAYDAYRNAPARQESGSGVVK